MAYYKSEQAKRTKPQIEMDDADGGLIPFTFVCPAVAVGANDVIELGVVPSGFLPASVQTAVAANGPTTLGNLGFLSAAGTAVATVLAAPADNQILPCLTAALPVDAGDERVLGVKGLVTTAAMAGKIVMFVVALVAA